MINRGLALACGGQNQPVNMLRVVSGRHELLLQQGEQLRIGGRVVRPDVVRRVDDAAAQEPEPDAVGNVAGKPGALGS
jgi:hypothetical protein